MHLCWNSWPHGRVRVPRVSPEKHTEHWLVGPCIRHVVDPPAEHLFLHLFPASVSWPHLPSIPKTDLLVGPSCSTLDAGQISLKTLDCVTVLFTEVFLYMLFKYYNRVGILFGATRRTLLRRLEPREYALGVKYVLARKAALSALYLLKTDDTCFGKVGRTLPLLNGLIFAFGSAGRHRRAPAGHYEIEYLKFYHEFPQAEHRR